MGMLSQTERRDTLDCAKGILIFLIVVGHNHQLVDAFPSGRWFLYNWHVYSFFLISAFLPFRPHEPGFFLTRAVRYYVPFILFFTLVWASTGGWDQPLQKVLAWLSAVVIGSADFLGDASGARLYWFLPALLGLTAIRWTIAKTGGWERYLLPVVAVSGFLFSGLLPDRIEPFIPLGLPIALYAIGPCLVFGAFMTYALAGSRFRLLTCGVLSVIVLALCTLIASLSPSTLVLAAFKYYDIRELHSLVVHALLAIAACSAVVLLLALSVRPALLAWLGRSSLLIYLSHQIFYSVLVRLLRRASPDVLREHEVAAGLVLVFATLVLSGAFAYCVTNIPRLRRFLTPRDLGDWLEGLGVRRVRNPSQSSVGGAP